MSKKDFILRPWCKDDKPQMKALWAAGFGDDDAYIENYFDLFLSPKTCIVAEADGKVVSAMYFMEGIKLYTGRKTMTDAAYSYSLATLPEYRDNGMATAVYCACMQEALTRSDAFCVLPAKPELYPFYESIAGAKTFTYARELRISREDLMAYKDKDCLVSRISGFEYHGLREVMLGGTPHAYLPMEFSDLEEYQAQSGGLFMTSRGIVSAEVEGDVCKMVEVLDPDGDGMAAAAAAAGFCPAKEYIIRTPLFFDGKGEERPFMMATFKDAPPRSLTEDFWWGLAFD